MLQGAGGAAAVAIAGGGIAELLAGSKPSKPLPHIPSFAVKPAGREASFRSQPHLRPPTVTTTAVETAERLGRGDPRLLFLGPGPVTLSGSEQYGPLIVARDGTPVWFRPLSASLQVSSFFSSSYRGKPVLVWWEGKIQQSGYGQGEAVLLDRSYQEVARVRAAGGRSMDLHALTLTPQGTALFTCYPETVPMDLSSIGAPRDSQVLESIIQEVDIATGRLLFEWRGLEHVPVAASRSRTESRTTTCTLTRSSSCPTGTCSCRRDTLGRFTSSTAARAPSSGRWAASAASFTWARARSLPGSTTLSCRARC